MPERSASRTQRHSYGLKSGAYFAVRCLRTRRRNRLSRTAQTVEVKFNGVVHFAFDAVSRLARGDAAGEIGRIGGIAGRSFFNDDQVAAHFNPACLRILFCVPAARSSLGFPAIVTTPFSDHAYIGGGHPAVDPNDNHTPPLNLILRRILSHSMMTD